jgi:hypothetical protein
VRHAASMLKRNDKVYILCPMRVYRKMSDQVELFVGKKYIIKQINETDEFSGETWARIHGPMSREFRFGKGKIEQDYVGIQLEVLFKYTRIGELLYG